MLPSSVDYYRASSVADAVAKLKGNPEAKLLAGGHSLIPAMKLRLNSPAILIDISGLKEMTGISENNGVITIGSMVTHGQIAKSELIKSKLPILTETADMIGDVQVRNVGTMGGSIAHADPSADWPAALLATGAIIVTDQREIPADDFFMGFFTTALEEEEIITAIKIPVPENGTKMTYQKFFQPASRFAIVGCAAVITASGGTITDAKVAFTGVSDGPFRDSAVEDALIGQPDNDTAAEAAAKLAAEDVMISEDHYASEEYRKHLAKVYAKKALRMVCGRVS
ncbi:FAD binding domain-containing protein [Jiulongibacter sp. NS-SX5]|uniref:FAD binding domain-containing protein n=1 Tax=Jiulongibacter sp. NS-SX5 TaxID=3463854 RepID=UPI0040588AA7